MQLFLIRRLGVKVEFIRPTLIRVRRIRHGPHTKRLVLSTVCDMDVAHAVLTPGTAQTCSIEVVMLRLMTAKRPTLKMPGSTSSAFTSEATAVPNP